MGSERNSAPERGVGVEAVQFPTSADADRTRNRSERNRQAEARLKRFRGFFVRLGFGPVVGVVFAKSESLRESEVDVIASELIDRRRLQ